MSMTPMRPMTPMTPMTPMRPMRCSARTSKNISIWISAHGYEAVSQQEQTISMRTRAHDTINYDGTLKVFHLSMAGLANVTTEMGVLYKKYNKFTEQSEFLDPDIVELLHHRSTEYATLTSLVNKVYGKKYDKYDECKEDISIVDLKLKKLKEEMLALEELAGIKYSKFSPPTIKENPYSNKVYSLKPNPGENIRNDSSSRSNPVRLSGYAPHNLFWAFYGLYILDTSDKDLAYFSISNLPVDEHGFVDPREIIKKNLLTLENYHKLKRYLNARDFSGVPDSHVSDIGNDLQASIVIFKKFCEYTGIVYSVRRRKFVLKHPIIATHIDTLRGAVTLSAEKIIDAIKHLHESTSKVSDARAEFKRTADLANKAEEKYEALKSRPATRLLSTIIEPTLRAEYDTAESIWQEAKTALEQAKANDTLASENAQQVEKRASEIIIDTIKKCIDDIIRSSEDHAELKRILKNIIMSNKLKNILKTAIFYKKISLNQIILFFSGLEYQELGIADPACSVIKPLPNPEEVNDIKQFDTQELVDSSFTPPPLFEDILDFIKKKIYPSMASPKRMRSSVASDASHSSRSSRARRARRSSPASHTSHLSGGAKRKYRMRRYSRKRRTRRKRYTRRRAS
jgi:hypothetical protein